jgi:hypothetical protein
MEKLLLKVFFGSGLLAAPFLLVGSLIEIFSTILICLKIIL